MNKLMIVALFFSFLSCTKESTPESALKDFISYRFDSGQGRDSLLKMTTGSLNSKIENMPEEDLRKFIDVKDLKKRKLKILIKNCEDETCYLTYILRYVKGEKIPKDFAIEVKKIAQVNKVKEKWLLSDVSNIKTFIDAKRELKVSEEGGTEK